MPNDSRRQAQIDSAVDAASGTDQERDAKTEPGIKGVTADMNPEKPGSTLHKMWERKRVAGTLQAQK